MSVTVQYLSFIASEAYGEHFDEMGAAVEVEEGFQSVAIALEVDRWA